MFGFLKSKNARAAEKLVAEINETAFERARVLWEKQIDIVSSIIVKETSFDEISEDMILRIVGNKEKMQFVEFRFIWGWFSAFVEETDFLPTKGSLRASVHLFGYIVRVGGYDTSVALEKTRIIDAEFNAADPFFDVASKLGFKSYHEPELPHLALILDSLGRAESIQLS